MKFYCEKVGGVSGEIGSTLIILYYIIFNDETRSSEHNGIKVCPKGVPLFTAFSYLSLVSLFYSTVMSLPY
ncbi:hypothetical protein T02_8245 [Trichinella nativa]|uniref:Uncharacterized protein n=1 Tax=Trichinella nativa TaxID=6335 RepID=A0A0V1KJN3_9BILA|nr:hypothetical protein T02_8245 [Trichinella nativa]